jgi:hypothetical protein
MTQFFSTPETVFWLVLCTFACYAMLGGFGPRGRT